MHPWHFPRSFYNIYLTDFRRTKDVMIESIEYDLVICGSGLAGLRAAIEATKKMCNNNKRVN